MPKFTDRAGRDWVVEFTVGGIKRCRAELGIDLAALAADEFKAFLAVAGDPVRLADCLSALCRGQHPDVPLDEFYEALVGDTLHAAAEAFEESFLLFCPSRQRETFRTLAAKTLEMEATILAAIRQQVETDPSSTIVTASRV